jgi:2-polyprenyl-6-methoxyphenol hydroxylase-like FAD-dependent oxidoreductase
MTILPRWERAIVIGSGIAGLLAARILAEYMKHVIVIERDALPAGPEFRAGVPQARHVHFLLLRGKAIIERLFPGIVAELEAAGAVRLDWTQDCKIYSSPGWFRRFPSEYIMLGCSRTLLEWTIRKRLVSWDNVRIVTTTEAIGLLAENGRNRVVGVHVRQRKPEMHELGAEEDLMADLVVDASGRDSRVPEWLKSLGYEPPEETVVNGFAGYASQFYQCPEDLQGDWRLLAVLNAYPLVKRGGVIFPIEGNRWLCTLVGVAHDYPATDQAGFLAFAQSLLVPDVYEAIRQAAPLSAVTGYQRMENRWRRYERLLRWPDGLIVIGDAVCAFNPIFGQGMTVAAQSTMALGHLLGQRQFNGNLTGLAKQAQKALAKISATPWAMASGEDLRLPEAEGDRPGRLTSMLYKYSDAFRELLPYDQKAMRAFVEVTHLLKPPTALFRPRLVLGVLGQMISKRKPGQRQG